MNTVKDTTMWKAVLAGGLGSAIAFGTFFLTLGQHLEAHTNDVHRVSEIATKNAVSILEANAKFNEQTTAINTEIAEIKTAIAVIQQKQTSQKESLTEMKEEQKSQTIMIQQILREVKKP